MTEKRCVICGKILPTEGGSTSDVPECPTCQERFPAYAQVAWKRFMASRNKLRAAFNPKVISFRKRALHKPIEDLIVYWKKAGLVHTSLTALTHESHGEPFKVVWSEKFSQGVLSHDNYARNFNEGVKYPNIRLTGIADLEHLRYVTKPTEIPQDPEEITKFQPPLSHRDGNGVFARSIAEVMVIAMVTAHNWGLTHEEVDPATLSELLSLLTSNRGSSSVLEQAWYEESLGRMFEDVQAALASDVLEIRRFVRTGELFLLCMEKWV